MYSRINGLTGIDKMLIISYNKCSQFLLFSPGEVKKNFRQIQRLGNY